VQGQWNSSPLNSCFTQTSIQPNSPVPQLFFLPLSSICDHIYSQNRCLIRSLLSRIFICCVNRFRVPRNSISWTTVRFSALRLAPRLSGPRDLRARYFICNFRGELAFIKILKDFTQSNQALTTISENRNFFSLYSLNFRFQGLYMPANKGYNITVKRILYISRMRKRTKLEYNICIVNNMFYAPKCINITLVGHFFWMCMYWHLHRASFSQNESSSDLQGTLQYHTWLISNPKMMNSRSNTTAGCHAKRRFLPVREIYLSLIQK